MERQNKAFFTQAGLVTLGCLSGAIYCGVLLYRDVQNLGGRSGTPIAKLERLEAKVRLKAAKSFVWGPAHIAQELYLKDSVQTAPNGGAAVQFKDGSVLEVGENSLIVIDQIANLSLGFLKGSAILRTQSGDTRITVDESGAAKSEKLPVRLIKPVAFSELLSEKSSRTVDFSWSLSAQATPNEVRLEISPDRKFKSKNVKSIPIAGSVTEASVSLPTGRFYWRVVGVDLQAEPGQFRVDSVSALKPIFPAGQTLDSFGDTAATEFNWKPEPEDSALEKFSHKIEISKSPDFNHLVSTDEVAASSGVAQAKGLDSGTYYWRLVSTFTDSTQDLRLTSPTEKFQIQKIEKVVVNANQPEDQARLELLPGVHFSWSSETPGLNYRWEIRNPGSSTLRAEKSVQAATSLNLSHLPIVLSAGSYEWRVVAMMKEHNVGESAWRGVSFYEGEKPVLRTPLVQQEFRYWNEKPLFQMTWSAGPQLRPGERSYLVEIASTDEFKSPLRYEVNQPVLSSEKVAFIPGDQFWRVSVVDAKKQVVGLPSLVSHFYYGPYPPLRAPASITPAAGTVYNPLTQEKPLVVHWEPVVEAQAYELTVRQAGQVIVHQNTEKAEVELKGLKPGKYQFTISAIDRLKRKGEASTDREFEVTYGETLDAPESLSPEVQ